MIPVKSRLAERTRSHTKGMRRANWRTTFLRILFAVLNLRAVFGAHVVAAQSFPSPSPTIQKLPSFCNTTTPKGVEFMKALSAIIAHGDLTDIAFIEKALDTKLIPYPEEEPGYHEYVEYHARQPLAGSVFIGLDVHFAKAEQAKDGFVGILSFSQRIFPGIIISCTENTICISASDLSAHFGGGFKRAIPIVDFGEDPNIVQTKELGGVGKNGTEIYLSFTHSKGCNYVFRGNITENPP